MIKDSELRRWRGLTWMGWLNLLVLQWLGLRLTRVVEDDDRVSAFEVMAPVVPLSGYGHRPFLPLHPRKWRIWEFS